MTDGSVPVVRRSPGWFRLVLLSALSACTGFVVGIGFLLWVPDGWIGPTTHLQVTPGERWTAFVRQCDYHLLPDRDSVICIGPARDPFSQRVTLTPTDPPQVQSMHWLDANHLRIELWSRPPDLESFVTGVGDVRIEWVTP